MNKNYSTLALGIALAMSVTSANAEMPIDSASAGIAIQSVSDIDSGMALVLNAKKKQPNIHENLSFEGEFTYTLSSPSTSQTILGTDFTTELTVMSLAGYGVFTHPISSQLNVYGRVGLLYESVSAEACAGSTCVSADNSETGLSYGAGVQFNISDTMAVRADYTIIEADVSHIGVGVKMGF